MNSLAIDITAKLDPKKPDGKIEEIFCSTCPKKQRNGPHYCVRTFSKLGSLHMPVPPEPYEEKCSKVVSIDDKKLIVKCELAR